MSTTRKQAMDAANLLVRGMIRPDSITSDGVEAMAAELVLLDSDHQTLLAMARKWRDWVGYNIGRGFSVPDYEAAVAAVSAVEARQ